VLGADNRGAEGTEIECRDAKGVEGEFMARGCPPPQPTKGSAERHKLPQLAENEFWCILQHGKNTPNSHKSIIFDISAAHI